MNQIGANHELSLRVSVATLARVLFKHPKDGEMMLALERKATVRETEKSQIVEVISQPFGGAIRIKNISRLHDLIGDLHFDSERSRVERDFRLFIRPSIWPAVREFCIEQLGQDDDPILETDPIRELVEEFDDALGLKLKPEQYTCKPVATVVENDPTPTDNVHAEGVPTVRVYRIFEVIISDSTLMDTMLANNEMISNQELCKLALKDAQNGGKGRANAILALPLNQIHALYSTVPFTDRNTSIFIEQNRLDGSVMAILEDISQPTYQRL
ncbi:MAG TPA: hypothetical protein VK851_15580 [Anaerolineales bacterium]|nr:hypothetical protein [Anaerolineales bacterium]